MKGAVKVNKRAGTVMLTAMMISCLCVGCGPIMASLTVSAIPMLIMFIFLQKYYVEGIASTGIKG